MEVFSHQEDLFYHLKVFELLLIKSLQMCEYFNLSILSGQKLLFIIQAIYQLYHNFNQMRGIRKQLQLLSALGETILCYRLQPYEGLTEHLNKIFIKIKKMVKTNQFQEGISEMLTSKQSYQIRSKLNKLRVQNISKVEKYLVQIKINVYEKGSGQLYNSQKWEFVASFEDSHIEPITYSKEGIASLMEFVLKNLLYLNILPLNKNLRNKYMIDHKVTILPSESNIQLSIFQNIACRQFRIGKCGEKLCGKIRIKYFYNESKIQQNIKEIVNERFKTSLESSRKYSITSTECSNCRVSFYEHYDDELDITVLSSIDLGNENKQLGSQVQEEEEFQLLIQQSEQLSDEEFLKKNSQLFKQLIVNGYDYL